MTKAFQTFSKAAVSRIIAFALIILLSIAFLHNASDSYTSLRKADIMPSRDYHLERAYIGQNETGHILIAKKMLDQPIRGRDPVYECYGYNTYYPAEFSDDPGLYWVIPPLAHAAGITWQSAKSIFIFGMVGFSILILFIGFCALFRRHPFGIVISALSSLAIGVTASTITRDVYLAYLLALSWMPLTLWAASNLEKRFISAILIIAAACLFAGLSDIIRAHSGLSLVLFTLALILFTPLKNRNLLKKAALICVVFLSFSSLKFFISHAQIQRNILLQEYGESLPESKAHPFWHSLLIGLGYQQDNPFYLEYKDEKAMEIAEETNPDVCYLSEEYSQILREKYFEYIQEDPVYVLKSMAYKATVSAYKMFKFDDFLLIINLLGLCLVFFVPIDWRVYFAFAVTIGFNVLPGILVVPQQSYILGAVIVLTVGSLHTIFRFIEANHHSPKNTTN